MSPNKPRHYRPHGVVLCLAFAALLIVIAISFFRQAPAISLSNIILRSEGEGIENVPESTSPDDEQGSVVLPPKSVNSLPTVTTKHSKNGGKSSERKPSIILFLADDLGYGEVNNKTFSMPINALDPDGGRPLDRSRMPWLNTVWTPNWLQGASEGMLLTMAYSPSSVCTPSRMSILQERHVGAFGVRGNKDNGRVGHDQDLEDNRTFVHDLRDAGYRTGVVGKWRLGSQNGAPWNQGFDMFYGMDFELPSLMFPPFLVYYNRSAHGEPPKNDLERMQKHRSHIHGNSNFHFSERTCPLHPGASCQSVHDLVRDKALQFIQENRDRPFFLFWSNPAPHAGFYHISEAKEDFWGAPVKRLTKQRVDTMNESSRGHASQIEQHLDQDVKALLELLRGDPDLDKSTFVIFTSDNGPHALGFGYDDKVFESSGGLRGKKFTMNEGGIRVPTFIRWPGVIPPGTVNNVPFVLYDLGATFRELAGLEAVYKRGRFGEPGGAFSMLKTWTGQGNPLGPPEREWMHFELCRDPEEPETKCISATILMKEWYDPTKPLWKIINEGHGRHVMFDIRADPQERHPVSNQTDVTFLKLKGLHGSVRSSVTEYRKAGPNRV